MSDSKDAGNGPTGPKDQAKETYGFELYPNRTRPDTARELSDEALATSKRRKFLPEKGTMRLGNNQLCKLNVLSCAETDPRVLVLLGALKRHGCPVKVDRHVCCEDCEPAVQGGYDSVNNEVVICQNKFREKPRTCSVMAHELIHMFDNCRAKFDFKNLEHLACTEIRAANLLHCDFYQAYMSNEAELTNIKNTHQRCVKNSALKSIMATRNITVEEGVAVINKVFTRCYNDREPLGRIAGSVQDFKNARGEAFNHGYTNYRI